MKEKIGRNDLCPCGSKKKYRKCCMERTITKYDFQLSVEDSPAQDDSYEETLLANADYPALLKYRKEWAIKFPEDVDAQKALGEAYTLNQNYMEALAVLTPLHRETPDAEDVQYLILDVLRAENKSINDFEWLSKPTLIALDADMVDACYHYLKKRKFKSIAEIYNKMSIRGYLMFSEQELLNDLKGDPRFIVEHPDDSFSAQICVAPQKGGKRK